MDQKVSASTDTTPTDPVEIAVPRKAPGIKSYIVLYSFIVLCFLVPFLYWQGTWFGMALSDEKLREYLSLPNQMTAENQPRHIQHALEQLSHRMTDNPVATVEFYSLLVSKAEHQENIVRATVAWVMSYDKTNSPELHQALLKLLADEQPFVRYQAALSLAVFNDSIARAELGAMLNDRELVSPVAGVVRQLALVEQEFDVNKQLLALELADGSMFYVNAPVAGILRDCFVAKSDKINVNDKLCSIRPGKQQIVSALQALALIGEMEDLAGVETYYQVSDADISRHAKLTGKQIIERSKKRLGVKSTVEAFEFTDGNAQPLSRQSLLGKIWVANFIFTRCNSICPPLTSNMKKITTQFKDQQRVHFVSYSVDPAFDTPEQLTVYAKQYQADSKRWHFLTGQKDKLYHMIEKNFKLVVEETESEADFIHSPRMVLIDQKGQIRNYYNGLDGQDLALLVRDIRVLLSGRLDD